MSQNIINTVGISLLLNELPQIGPDTPTAESVAVEPPIEETSVIEEKTEVSPFMEKVNSMMDSIPTIPDIQTTPYEIIGNPVFFPPHLYGSANLLNFPGHINIIEQNPNIIPAYENMLGGISGVNIDNYGINAVQHIEHLQPDIHDHMYNSSSLTTDFFDQNYSQIEGIIHQVDGIVDSIIATQEPSTFLSSVNTIEINNISSIIPFPHDINDRAITDSQKALVEHRFLQMLRDRNIGGDIQGNESLLQKLIKSDCIEEEKIKEGDPLSTENIIENTFRTIEAPSLEVLEKYKQDFLKIEKEFRNVHNEILKYKKEENELKKKANLLSKSLMEFQNGVNTIAHEKSGQIFQSAYYELQQKMYQGVEAYVEEVRSKITKLVASHTILSKKRAEFHKILQSLNKYRDDIGKGGIGTCAICMTNELNMALVPCGHVFCGDCCSVGNSVSKKCPTCRANVDKTVKLFL